MATCSAATCDVRVTADQRHLPYTPGDDVFCGACCPRTNDDCATASHVAVRATIAARIAAAAAAAAPVVCLARLQGDTTACVAPFGDANGCCDLHCASDACGVAGHVQKLIARLRLQAQGAAAAGAVAAIVCTTRPDDVTTPCVPPFGDANVCCDLHCANDTCQVPGHLQKYIARLRRCPRGGADQPAGAASASGQPVVNVTLSLPPGYASASAGGHVGSSKVPSSANWYGLQEETLAHHPTRFTDARATALLAGLRGKSLDELRLTRQCKRVMATARGGAVFGPGSGLAVSYEVLMREPVTTIIKEASLRRNTSSSERKVTAALIAVMRVLAARDGAKDPSDPTAIRIEASAIRDGGEGHVLGFVALGEVLVHTLEAAGRERFLTWVRDAINESKKDPIRLVRTSKAGTSECVCWVTYVVKCLMIGYLEWLANRRHTWDAPALMELITGPLHPFPLRDSPDATLCLLAFFVVLGLLDLVDDADEDGDLAGDSLVAMEEGWKAFLRAWKAFFVSCGANRLLWDKVPKGVKDAVDAEAQDAQTRPPPATSRQKRTERQRKLKAEKAAGAAAARSAAAALSQQAAAAAGAGDHTANVRPPPTGAATAKDLLRYPPVTGNPTFTKCHWVGPDGSPCARANVVLSNPSANPLCKDHRQALWAMTPATKATAVAKMKAAGLPLAM